MSVDRKQYEWAREELDPSQLWDTSDINRYQDAARKVLQFVDADIDIIVSKAEWDAKNEFFQAEGARELANQEIMKRHDAEVLLRKFGDLILSESDSDIPESLTTFLQEVQAYFD